LGTGGENTKEKGGKEHNVRTKRKSKRRRPSGGEVEIIISKEKREFTGNLTLSTRAGGPCKGGGWDE